MPQKRALLQEDVGLVNPLQYGTALNATTLNAAIAAIGGTQATLFLTAGTWTLATNVTVPRTIKLWIPSGVTVAVNGGITLTINGPYQADIEQWYSGAGSVVFNAETWGSIDGNQYITLNALVAAVGTQQKTVHIGASLSVTANVTVPNTLMLHFITPGTLAVATGVTVTINGGIDAPTNARIFTVTGTGRVLLNDRIPKVYPQWWGALGDFATSGDAAPIQAAMDSGAKFIELGSGGYVLETFLQWNAFSMTLHGTYLGATLIPAAGAGLPYIIDIIYVGSAGLGAHIDGVRFTNQSDASAFNGVGIRATTKTYIDSHITNCWFSMTGPSSIGFDGRASDAEFLNNIFDAQTAGIRIRANSSIVRLTNNLFANDTYRAIDLDGTIAQPINEVTITDTFITVPTQASQIRANYVTNLKVNGLILDSASTDPSVTLTVIELVNSTALIADVTINGTVVTGTSKVAAVLDMTNSRAVVTGGYWTTGINHAVVVRAGTVDLLLNGTTIMNIQGATFLFQDATGIVQILNTKVEQVVDAFVEMTGTNTFDFTLANNYLKNARYLVAAAYGVHITTTGTVLVAQNTFVDGGATMVPPLSMATTDGKSFIAGNTFVGLTGGTAATGTGYRKGFNVGDNPQFVAGLIPATGTYIAGDLVMNAAQGVLGAASSQYTVLGWRRITTGSSHVLNTDWVEMRVLTGT